MPYVVGGGVREEETCLESPVDENLKVDGRVPGREAGMNPSACITEDLVPGKGTDECKELVEFTENLLPVGIGNDKVQYIDQLKADKSLDTIRKLAEREERGYRIVNGVLVQRKVVDWDLSREVVVVPRPRVNSILVTAHDNNGHL